MGRFFYVQKECDYMGYYDGGRYYPYPWESPEPGTDSSGQPLPGQGVLIPITIDTPDYSDPATPNPNISGTTTPPPSTTDPYAGLEVKQQQLADQLKASKIAALDKVRTGANSALDTEASTIAPQYYDKRNQAAAASDVGAENFVQYMASRGIKGSAGGMPEIYRNTALQGQIGALNQQEQAANNDIASRRSGIETNYQSDVAAANADAEAVSLQNYIDNMKLAASQKVADNAAMGMTSTGQTTLEGQRAADTRQADLVAAYQANIGRFADNYQQEINNVQNDGDPTNDWQIAPLEAARTQKKEAQATAEAAAAKAKSVAEQQQYDNEMKLWVAEGTASRDYPSLGLKAGDRTGSYNLGAINAATAQKNANKPAAEKSTDSLYNSTYNTVLDLMDKGLPRSTIHAKLENTQGLTSQQKADIENAVYPE